ncbi:methyltransferase domain-containing protein [Paenibacillus hunanensis]|uniref:methyltransferase domain-containing protein n=1 Tax=Paenibacillus hunanensis TaxID=539262 RepID=UPI002A6A1871|nr:methyltransferase domain-containing protein [Paenibacillus hunanensis]WPP39743.1 methyltransferase domain-containing protein [Paenibacillus hunanensis]
MSLDNLDVKKFYESQNDIWPVGDLWHEYTKIQIEIYLNKKKQLFLDNPSTLNAGSGGNTYNLDIKMHHSDIIEKHIKNCEDYTVCSIEKTPFKNEAFGSIICVGSVINYCDALKAISEMSRITKHKGYLVLEFESSWSMEFYKSTSHKKSACVIKTKYFNEDHILTVYSIEYIKKLLKMNNFKLVDSSRFHIISSYAYFKTKSENDSAKFCYLDVFFRKIPFFSKRSHNIILLCQKL